MLQENEQALRKYRPELWELLQKVEKEEAADAFDGLRLDQARDGNSVLTIQGRDREYRLNSRFAPGREADKWAEQYKKDFFESIYVLYGFGNGCFAQSLVRIMNDRDTLLIYEPSRQIFFYVLEHIDIAAMIQDSRIAFVLEGMNHAEFYFYLQKRLDWRTMEALSVGCHPVYDTLFAESYVAFLKQIKELQELARVIQNTDSHFAGVSVRNTLNNMKWIKGSNIISDFVGKFPKEYPVIIVSAGPSLDKNIELLSEAKGKAFILAVDAAIPVLERHKIEIDAMITIDAKKNNEKVTREFYRDIPLFCGFVSNRHILIFNEGKKIWVTGAWYMNSLYEEMGHSFPQIHMGGSVATTAFSVCQAMGFQNIILIGQDLAYSGGVSHAGGEVKNIPGEESGQREVEAALGGTVRSRYDWLIYLKWFETVIEQYPDLNVVDATEGGALIHGSRVMTLAEAIETYCTQEFSMRGLLEETAPTFTEEEYLKVREELMRIGKDMEKIRRLSKDGIVVCEQVLQQIKMNGEAVSYVRYAKELEQINRDIAEIRVYELLDYFITDTAAEDLKSINRMTGKKASDLEDTYLSAKAMYESLAGAVETLRIPVKNQLQKVE